ncbi:MAG: DnaJ domain-containing protein [Luteitalea sp.]|nr:DnaJ domain-containing protein [Luteitalea sp.]
MEPAEILGVPDQATDEEIRAAYLRRVRECPPDRSPEEFERIRDAYETLCDPRRRLHHRLFSVDPTLSLAARFARHAPERRFVGPGPWLDVLKGQ